MLIPTNSNNLKFIFNSIKKSFFSTNKKFTKKPNFSSSSPKSSNFQNDKFDTSSESLRHHQQSKSPSSFTKSPSSLGKSLGNHSEKKLNEVPIPGASKPGSVYGQKGKSISISSLKMKQFWTASTKRIFLHKETAHSWDSLEIPPEWSQNIKNMGLSRPTLMQMGIFREFFQGKDIFLRCGTGTGKTFALLLACLVFVHLNSSALSGGVSCLLVVPTLPLAHQLLDWASEVIGKPKDSPEIKRLIQLLIPGPVYVMNHGNQEVDCIPQILVALPSQLQSREYYFDWGKLRVLVLDEIDTLLRVPSESCTSKQQYKWRVNPSKLGKFLIHQTREQWINARPLVVASSATLERNSLVFLEHLGLEEDAIKMLTNEAAPFAQGTNHEYILLSEQLKPKEEPEIFLQSVIHTIVNLYDENSDKLGVLFCNPHVGAQRIKELLSERALKVEFIQNILADSCLAEETEKLNNWKSGLLMTSSLDAYGMDIPVLDYVIILGMPEDFPAYLHMSGRVGRLRGKQKTRVITVLEGKEQEKQFVDLVSKGNIVPVRLCPLESTQQNVLSLMN